MLNQRTNLDPQGNHARCQDVQAIDEGESF